MNMHRSSFPFLGLYEHRYSVGIRGAGVVLLVNWCVYRLSQRRLLLIGARLLRQ